MEGRKSKREREGGGGERVRENDKARMFVKAKGHLD